MYINVINLIRGFTFIIIISDFIYIYVLQLIKKVFDKSIRIFMNKDYGLSYLIIYFIR